MSLKLYYHPLASFCWKALIALYENGTAFEPQLVELASETSRADFFRLWPLGKFPVLRDEQRKVTVPESSIIIEYLAHYYPGRTALLPPDADLAREVRLRDRLYDHYVHQPMQKIVIDKLRPPGKNDAHGVEMARAELQTAYAMLDVEMANRQWAAGDTFTMADCAAAPALYYANRVQPFGEPHRNLDRYLGRLKDRPAFARVLEEAQPYFKNFPG
jgi:glutathione S-transferase